MPADGLIAAYRGRLSKDVQDAILISDVAADLRRAADTIDVGNAVSPIPGATFLDRAWNAANEKARELGLIA